MLGSDTAGWMLDPSGRAVVNVLNPAAAEKVRAAGAIARIVRYSFAELNSVRRIFDASPGVPNTAWGIDPSTDQVVLTVSDAAPAAGAARLLTKAASFGDRVRVRRIAHSLTEQLFGGDELNSGEIICSSGFNVTKDGHKYVLTAGHCTKELPDWSGVGPSVGSGFPGTDYGLIANDSSAGPGVVDMHNGSQQRISSFANAVVGAQVCKSGSSTGVTCGKVTAIDQTVDYHDGKVVHGLIETNVHSAHGDSGGALFNGTTALGMVSGGDGTVDYFQPVEAALKYYGVALA